MATYILLMTLTPEGREKTLRDPEQLLRAQQGVSVTGVQCMGVYGVIGEYDFVTWLEAPSNESAARFSLELGVRAGVHITTLPAVALGEFKAAPHLVATAEAPMEKGEGDPV